MTFWMEQKTESYLIELVKIAILQEKKVQQMVVGSRWDVSYMMRPAGNKFK